MRLWAVALTLFGALAACTHWGPRPTGPEGVARAYAQALEENRLDEAWAHSVGLPRADFDRCYADAATRALRVRSVRAAADGDGAQAALQLVLENGRWRVKEAAPAQAEVEQQASEVLRRFVDATEAGRFDEALSLMSASWRGRYTAQRLEQDFVREPLSRERVSRARAAMGQARWAVDAAGAQLALGEGRAVRLSREADTFKVAALE